MIKKKLFSAIALLLALICVVSCGPTTAIEIPGITDAIPGEESGGSVIFTPTIPDGILIAGPEISSSCAVIYPSGATKIKAEAENFADYFKSVIPGSSFVARNHSETAAEEYSIILENDSSISSSYSVKLDGKTIRVSGKDTANTLEALSYLKLTALRDGYFAIPEDLNFQSGEGPAILTQYPEKYYYYEDVYTPELEYTFDNTTLNAEASRLVIGGVDVTKKAVWLSDKVTLNNMTFPAGDHTVLLYLEDKNGNAEVLETLFSCGEANEMNLYTGELHGHTLDSDGKGTIEEAYAYARDVAKLDYFSITDHSNYFQGDTYQVTHVNNAESFNEPGEFVALYGFEQTYSAATYYGHLNTINYGKFTTRSTLLEDYYTAMTEGDSAIVMFNHPGYKWGNFCEYEFWTEEFDKVVNLSEIKGKGYDIEYALSLTKGWHLSPVYNEDNHQKGWGNVSEYCGYVLAPALTRQNIVEAFQKNRTYTTTDKSLKIYYKINDEWMGARLQNPDKLKVSITLSTEKPVGLGTVSLIGEDNIVVAKQNLGRTKKYTWEFEIDPDYDYYYVKVSCDTTWCVTAPIWIENRDELTVTSIEQQLVTNAVNKNEQRILATVKNSATTDMTNVKVDYYLSSTAGFDITALKPTATVEIGTIRAGESATVYADLNYDLNNNRIYAVASGETAGKACGAVKYCEISNLYFSEVFPMSRQGGGAVYDYIELYNNSNQTVNLFNYTIRYYAKPGANSESIAENTWKLTGTIAPHSTLVLWFVPESSKLSVADFNRRFGTNLVGGKDIIMIVGNTLPENNPVQLEMLNGSKVIARCWYNWEGAKDVLPDKSIRFKYPTNYTCTQVVDKARIGATPGKLEDGQMPEQVKK
ncbi:MAG: CehA/McbA family metallohydrolase [Clostridia bacterium]|nr:CehA/McbA family metallohydrolase [Clostridia bacterium]